MTAEHAGVFRDAAAILGQRIGLRLDPSEHGRLARCVVEEAGHRGIKLTRYPDLLRDDPLILQQLVDRVTVQETSFFRDRRQFEVLGANVLPSLPEPITVWSAGCSNGQETYSLAMVLAEAGVRSWRIVATDISRPALERTRSGRYLERELAGVDGARRSRHFTQVGRDYEVVQSLRERVTVVQHNLVTELPPFPPNSIDVLFCRNVLIYFGAAEVQATLGKFERWLAPRGWLFLGFSESLWHLTDRFQLVRVEDAFLYRPGQRMSTPRGPVVPAQALSHRVAPSRASPPPRTPRPPARRVERPGSAAARPKLQSSTGPAETTSDLLAEGEEAIREGRLPEAITAFRKVVYLDPDLPVAHLHLGFALERAGDAHSARRAFAASRAALARCDPTMLEEVLEGYRTEELVRMLDDRLLGSPQGDTP